MGAKEAKLAKTTVPLSRHELAMLREKSRQFVDRKGLPSVTLPPAEVASSEQPTVPPPKPRTSETRVRGKSATVEILAVNLRHDPRSEG